MIVYKVTAGLAHDLRYEEDNYALAAGEFSIPGFGELPSLDSLSTPAALALRRRDERLRVKREQAMGALAMRGLSAAIADPNAPQEVKDYADELARP